MVPLGKKCTVQSLSATHSGTAVILAINGLTGYSVLYGYSTQIPKWEGMVSDCLVSAELVTKATLTFIAGRSVCWNVGLGVKSE